MDEIAKRMAELAEKFGPAVIEAARGAAQIEAYSSMVAGAVALACAAGLALAGRFFWRKADREDFDGYSLAACIFFGVAALLTIPGVWSFVDPWVWTTINHPDLWIAKKVMHL